MLLGTLDKGVFESLGNHSMLLDMRMPSMW